MDDFRVASVPPTDPYREHEPADSAKRKKGKHHHHHAPAPEKDDVAALTAETGTGDEADEDYYAPSDPSDEPE